VPTAPLVSVALIVKVLDPEAVGMPEITPLDALSDKPAGREPTTPKVYGAPLPPVAETVCE